MAARRGDGNAGFRRQPAGRQRATVVKGKQNAAAPRIGQYCADCGEMDIPTGARARRRRYGGGTVHPSTVGR